MTGYSQLYARTCPVSIRHALTHDSNKAKSTHVSTKTDQGLIVRPSSSGTEKENDQVEAAEKEAEEDELVFKKYLDTSQYFAIIFFALLLGYFFRYIKISLPFRKQFSYFISLRSFHLLFRSIRI